MLADDRRPIGREDELAAMVMSKLAKSDLIVSIIHASSGAEFYELNRRDNRYEPRRDQSGRFRGYLRNVALNKVLLSSSKWPFILADPLRADVVVAIDVKGNTAGFTVVSKTGEHVFTRTRLSRQKEKLLADQCRQYLVEGIKEITKLTAVVPREIVIHRDGRLFDSELAGILEGMKELKGVIADDARVTCVDIPKTSFTSVRLFDREDRGREPFYQNPELGSYVLLGKNDGYLCTTGRSFLRRGTVKPLHVRRVYGEMPLRDCLQDVFALASLTWTQPEGCARHPISIKLNDRQLFEVATPFDEDAYEFAPLNQGEGAK
jgi:argonaute-like protein implicated in RNA metabolism and viral defense